MQRYGIKRPLFRYLRQKASTDASQRLEEVCNVHWLLLLAFLLCRTNCIHLLRGFDICRNGSRLINPIESILHSKHDNDGWWLASSIYEQTNYCCRSSRPIECRMEVWYNLSKPLNLWQQGSRDLRLFVPNAARLYWNCLEDEWKRSNGVLRKACLAAVYSCTWRFSSIDQDWSCRCSQWS